MAMLLMSNSNSKTSTNYDLIFNNQVNRQCYAADGDMFPHKIYRDLSDPAINKRYLEEVKKYYKTPVYENRPPEQRAYIDEMI